MSEPYLPNPAASALAIARVDLAAIARNIGRFKSKIADQDLLAVVKANAFGHGAVPIAKTALAAGASWLGVATVAEALELRDAGITAPIISWLPLLPFASADDYRIILDRDIQVSAIYPEELHRLVAATNAGQVARVHLKIDTGIHRGGCSELDWPELCETAYRLEQTGKLQVVGIWSHLSHGLASDSGAQNAKQSAALAAAMRIAKAVGLSPKHLHLANSGGSVNLPEAGLTMVRIGAGMYGIEPENLGLEFAMTVESKVAAIREIAAGDGVGYEHIWQADRPSRIALVPIGYADGLPRGAAGAQFWINGQRVDLVGRVSMDQATIDVTKVSAAVGDRVVMFSNGANGEPTPADWARWANTNQHDIFCGLGRRMQFYYS